jgi:hypothetical protein
MIPLTAYVLSITAYITALQIQSFEVWPHLSNLELADPDLSNQYPIHLLIESIFIDICARTSPLRPDGRTHGPKNHLWLDHF